MQSTRGKVHLRPKIRSISRLEPLVLGFNNVRKINIFDIVHVDFYTAITRAAIWDCLKACVPERHGGRFGRIKAVCCPRDVPSTEDIREVRTTPASGRVGRWPARPGWPLAGAAGLVPQPEIGEKCIWGKSAK